MRDAESLRVVASCVRTIIDVKNMKNSSSTARNEVCLKYNQLFLITFSEKYFSFSHEEENLRSPQTIFFLFLFANESCFIFKQALRSVSRVRRADIVVEKEFR